MLRWLTGRGAAAHRIATTREQIDPRLWDELVSHYAFLRALDPAQRQALLARTAWILASKAVSATAGLQMTDRIALAIAVTTSQLGSAQTLVFDEVDAGIGGAVAHTVGRLMRRLGRDRQVLAVTHLPQVAACADHHFVVAKQARGGATLSDVRSVAGEVRVAEVARMLGGEKLSNTTLAHAKEMLQG